MRRDGDKDCPMCCMSGCDCECATCTAARERNRKASPIQLGMYALVGALTLPRAPANADEDKKDKP